MRGMPNRYLGRLNGKSAIVTGAGAKGDGFGTGRAMALLFAGEGARVCLVDRDVHAVSQTLHYIEEIGGEAFVAVGDVTSSADCKAIASQTEERYGGIDILVNNVGVSAKSIPVDDVDLGEWRSVFELNLQSSLLMAKFTVPFMRLKGQGAILNISSIAGGLAYGDLSYGPSKAAMMQLTRELATLHGRDGIRVNSLAPGHIFTPLVEGILSEDARTERRMIGPLGLEGDAWDIARAALFLVSDEAGFISGACLPVDGGVSIVGSTRAMQLLSTV